MKSKNTIEFNGTRYDSVTGAVLHTNGAPAPKRTNIDGFFRNPRQKGTNLAVVNRTSTSAPAPQTEAKAQPVAVPTSASKPKRAATSNHVKHHTAQHSATLMRSGVQKPTFGVKKHISVQYDLPSTIPTLIVPKQSAYTLDEKRVARADSTERSPHVQRHAVHSKQAGLVTPLAVQPVPVKPEATDPTEVPAPNHGSKPVDIFEQAMANASHFVDTKAHTAHFRKRTKRHLATMGAGAFALLLIGGFVTYANSSTLQLKVASMRAGVGTTTMPDFKAAGFTYNGSKPKEGKVALNFSDLNGSYQLTQQPTNWDSEDLINHVGSVDASGFPTYSTLRTNNTIVYRLSNNSATWITSGTWYQLAGTGALTDDQVAALVKNL